jgi:hypothetical protein
LFLGLFLLWLFLEFVATRERIDIDLTGKVLTRRVRGVFRTRRQVIDLNDIKGIGIEMKWGGKGTKLQYLYLYGSNEKFLINSPPKRTIDQAKLGRILSELTLIPFQGATDATRAP